MFGTVEEAEKAAAMLRRFTPREVRVSSTPISATPQVVSFPGGGGEGWPLRSWDEVAEHIEWLAEVERLRGDQADKTDRRAGHLAQARAHLGAVKRSLFQPDRPFGDPVYSQVAGLCATLECLLETLA